MNIDPRADHWNTRYSIDGFLFGEQPNDFLVAQVGRLPRGAKVLSVADGEGRNSVWLAEQGFAVDAFDISEVAVAKARQLAARRGVHVDFHVGSVASFDWPTDHYDAVVAIFIQFLTPAERPALFDRVRSALHPGGLFVLEGYRVEQLAYGTGGPSVVAQLYSEPQIREELAEFQLLLVHSEDRPVQEGTSHAGMSALIEVVAQR